MAIELTMGDFDVADAAELPNELSHYEIAAAQDSTFQSEFDEWFELLCDIERPELMLALEQSCSEGILLPWDMPAVRLWTAPPEIMSVLHRHWDRCPRHLAVILAHYFYWLVRAERGRRRGSADWSPRSPFVEAAPAAFTTFSKHRPRLGMFRPDSE